MEISLDSGIAEALDGRDLTTRYLRASNPLCRHHFRRDCCPKTRICPESPCRRFVRPTSLEIPSADRRINSWLVQAGLFVDGAALRAPRAARRSAATCRSARTSPLPSRRARAIPAAAHRAWSNGLHGSRFFRDGLWTGFEGHDLDATLDLGETRKLQRVVGPVSPGRQRLDFPAPGSPASWFRPTGKTGMRSVSAPTTCPDKVQDKLIHEFALDLPAEPVGFVRVHAISPGVCPDWHPGRGEPCWIFADEIVCR